MKQLIQPRTLGVARIARNGILTIMVMGMLCSVALAQGLGGWGDPGGGGGGWRGGPGGRGPRAMTAADVPVAALSSALSLTGAQKTKIAKIQENFRSQRRGLMPQPGDQPDPDTMRANFMKMQSLNTQANKSINAVLTSSQKTALPVVLKDFGTLRGAGIPLELYGSLKLTAGQKTQLAAIAAAAQKDLQQKIHDAQQGGDWSSIRDAVRQSRQDTQQKSLAVLTDDQQGLVTQYKKDHPQPQRGGGGWGGGGGRGWGGPPPGAGGPPPGGDNAPPPASDNAPSPSGDNPPSPAE